MIIVFAQVNHDYGVPFCRRNYSGISAIYSAVTDEKICKMPSVKIAMIILQVVVRDVKANETHYFPPTN